MESFQNSGDTHTRIAWHPAFIEALQMELEEYQNILEFHAEYQLTSEPLKIDCVVIKKTRNIRIKKNIAAIFRKWNIVEYKSPGDYISVADFYKVYAYACLYVALNDISVTDLTITFIENRFPRKLITHLSEVRGYIIDEISIGVYNVTGDILPIQIIDRKKLSLKENLWLKGLSDRLKIEELNLVTEKAARKDKNAPIAAYLNTIANANSNLMEVLMMKAPKKTFEQVLKDTGWYAELEARGEARGEVKGEAKASKKWQKVVADKDAEIARLRTQLAASAT